MLYQAGQQARRRATARIALNILSHEVNAACQPQTLFFFDSNAQLRFCTASESAALAWGHWEDIAAPGSP